MTEAPQLSLGLQGGRLDRHRSYPTLNTMFNEPSTQCLTSHCLVVENVRMNEKARHPSMTRLFSAAKSKGVSGPSALAARLNVSEQVITNWTARGISATGALQAQKEFGCDANWILDDEHVALEVKTTSKATPAVDAIPPDVRVLMRVLDAIPLETRPDAVSEALAALVLHLPLAESSDTQSPVNDVTQASTHA